MSFNYAGSWKNQLGATMSLTVATDGAIQGWYKSPAAPAKAPVAGFVRDGFLVFSVAFEQSAGTMFCQPSSDDTTTFDSWWHFRLFDDPGPAWAAVRTGCDRFERS